MTATDAAVMDFAPAMPVVRVRHVAAVTMGNALEFYDFLTYAFFAAQIGRTFFPSADPSTSLLSALATFGAGFLMRPVGALVIGRIGDRVGRKPAMLLTFMLMGVAMIGLALTPSHRAIGIAAPILAILFRLIQGFALGGEIGPNTAYLVEAAPSHRRGLYVSMQYMSQDMSILVSGLIGFVLATYLSDRQLDDWGWRVAFLLGATIVPFGLVLRRQLAETLHSPAQQAQTVAASAPRLRMLALLAIVLLAGGTVASYLQDYLTTYATSTLRMSTRIGFLSTIAVGVFGMVCDPIGGWLSNRFGRKPVMLVPWLVLLVVTVPGFWLTAHYRTTGALIALTAAITICACISEASMLVSITESLPAKIRCGTLGLIYAFAISVFGGSAQFLVAWLTDLTGSPLAPAWYLTGAVAITLFAQSQMPESAPRKLEGAKARPAR